MLLRPAAPDTGIVFRRMSTSIRWSICPLGDGVDGRRYAHVLVSRNLDAFCQGSGTIRHPDVGVCRPRHRQRVCRPRRGRSAHSRRIGISLCIPDSIGRYRRTAGRQEIHPRQASRRSQDGDKWAFSSPSTAIVWPFRSFQPPGDRSHRAGSDDRLLPSILHAKSHARLSVSCRKSNGCAKRSGARGGLDNAVVLDEYRVSTPTASATATSSSSTRCSTPSVTSIPRPSAARLIHRAQVGPCAEQRARARNSLANADAREYVTFEDVALAPEGVTRWLAQPLAV